MSCFDDGNCGAVQIEYDGNGSLTQYTFPFPYEDELEVHVEKWDAVNFRYNRIERDQWSFDNLTTIKFETAPDYTFRIMRETDLEEMEVTFYPGSSIRAQDLNANFEQLQHAIQEGWCRVSKEFYCYLDEFIFDKRDAWTKEEQQTNKVIPEGNKIFLDDAITARHDTYLQDNKPTEPPYEQGGKRWYDTDKVNNYLWNDQIGAWIDYARTGPQGPKGEDGNYRIIIGINPPTHRPDGDPIQSGDIWFNNCTAETWIYYVPNPPDSCSDERHEGSWISFGNGGVKGDRGPIGNYQAIIGIEAPTTRPNLEPLENGDIWFNTCIGEAFWYFEGQWINFTANGTKGDTGFFKTICSLTAPKRREDNTPLQCGDFWFNTCTGEMYVWYDCAWLGISDASGPKGDTGERGPQGPAGKPGEPGNRGHIGDTPPENPDIGDWWFDTDCPSQQYIWDGTQWVGTSTPGPTGPMGRSAVVGDVPPANPNTGNLWYDTNCPQQSLYVFDGTYWVDVTKPGPVGPPGDGSNLNFIAPLQRTDDDVAFVWNSINELP